MKTEIVGFRSNFDLEQFKDTFPKNRIVFVNWLANEMEIKVVRTRKLNK